MYKSWIQEQWNKSNIISGMLALAIWGTIIYLAIATIDIPPILASAGGAIIMFFYKTKQDA